MNVSDFAEEYANKSDDDLLCLWAERDTLVPEAVMALESEVRNRGLNTANAGRVKKRRDAIYSRQNNLSMNQQVNIANYERNMRHFHGWEEPKFYSAYSGRDIRSTFGYVRHQYRVWKAFRDHTGQWPVLSIWYWLLSWIAFWIASFYLGMTWLPKQSGDSIWNIVIPLGSLIAIYGIRALGARAVRRLDWNRYVASNHKNPAD